MVETERIARLLKVLSVGTRVRIMQLLKGRALCVNGLVAQLGVTQGAVSQHLRCMREAGLVIDERCGFHVHYRLNEDLLAVWRGEIERLLDPAVGFCPACERSPDRCCCTDKMQGCKTPHRLEGKPEPCSPAQIGKCHGDVNKHPRTGRSKRKEARGA